MAKKKKTDIFDIMVLTPEEASKMLLEEAKKETPDLQVIEDLLVHTLADVNIKDEWGWTALMNAAASKNVKCVELLLNRPGIDVNVQDKDGWTALVGAIEMLDYVSVKLLLEAGANPNLQDHEGNSIAFQSLYEMIGEYEYANEFDDDTDYDRHDYATMKKIKDLLEEYRK